LKRAHREAFLAELERQIAQLVEGLGVPRLLAQLELEGRGTHDLDQARIGLAQVRVHRRGEQLGRHDDVRCGARLALDHLDPRALAGRLDHRHLVAVGLEARQSALDVSGQRGLGLDEAVLGDEVRGAAAEVGA